MNRFLSGVLLALILLPVNTDSVSTVSAVYNESSKCMVFTGENDGASTNVWFEYGMANSGYAAYKTTNQTSSGEFTNQQCGLPLFPGIEYTVRAAGDNGSTGEGYTYGDAYAFIMPTITPHPTTTHEQSVDTFLENGLDPRSLITTDIWQPYVGLMGGLFFGVLIGFIFMNVVTKQRTIALSVILLCLTGTTLWFVLPPEMIQIGQMLFIAGIAGLLYWLIMKRR